MLRLRRRDYAVLKAAPSDAAAIADLHDACFPRGWTTSEIEKLASQGTVTMLVARIVGATGENPVGFNIIRQTQDEAEILSLGVHADHRRAGVGGLLMRDAIRRLQGDRVEHLLLEVDGHNLPAVSLYRRLGFGPVGSRPGYYAQAGDDETLQRASALVMRLALR